MPPGHTPELVNHTFLVQSQQLFCAVFVISPLLACLFDVEMACPELSMCLDAVVLVPQPLTDAEFRLHTTSPGLEGDLESCEDEQTLKKPTLRNQIIRLIYSFYVGVCSILYTQLHIKFYQRTVYTKDFLNEYFPNYV